MKKCGKLILVFALLVLTAAVLAVSASAEYTVDAGNTSVSSWDDLAAALADGSVTGTITVEGEITAPANNFDVIKPLIINGTLTIPDKGRLDLKENVAVAVNGTIVVNDELHLNGGASLTINSGANLIVNNRVEAEAGVSIQNDGRVFADEDRDGQIRMKQRYWQDNGQQQEEHSGFSFGDCQIHVQFIAVAGDFESFRYAYNKGERSFAIGQGETLDINDGQFTVDSFEVWEGGALTVTSELGINNYLSAQGAVSINGKLVMNGGSELHLESSTFTVNGVLDANGGSNLNVNNIGLIMIAEGGEFNLYGGANLRIHNGGGVGVAPGAELNNSGRICNEGMVLLAGTLNNYGELEESKNATSFTVDSTGVLENRGYIYALANKGGDFGALTVSGGGQLLDPYQLRFGWPDENGEIDTNNLQNFISDGKGGEWSGFRFYLGHDYLIENPWTELQVDNNALTGGEITYTLEADENLEISYRGDEVVIGFKEWGRGSLSLKDEGNTEIAAIGYAVELPDTGWYYSQTRDENNFIPGSISFVAGTTELWFIRAEGFKMHEAESWSLYINQHEDGYFEDYEPQYIELFGRELGGGDYYALSEVSGGVIAELRVVYRENSERDYGEPRYDICITLDSEHSFDMRIEVEMDDGWRAERYIDCRKPVIFIADAIAHADMIEGSVNEGDDVFVEMEVKIENNPGLAGYNLTLSWENSMLQIESVEFNGDPGTTGLDKPGVNKAALTSVNVAKDSEENFTYDDDWLFKVKFRVVEQFVGEELTRELVDDWNVELRYAGDDNGNVASYFGGSEIIDMNPNLKNGTVRLWRFGDIYRDGKVNIKDAVRMAQILSRWDEQERISVDASEYAAANVMHIGEYTRPSSADLVRLMQFLAGWDVDLSVPPAI